MKALTVYNGDLIAGGNFDVSGGRYVNFIARWDGTSWHPLGLGMNGKVWTLTVYNGDLIAGGEFTQADGMNVNYIARWNGYSWHPLGSGLDGTPLTMTVYRDDLIVGGTFYQAGDSSASMIARWDGTSWHALGSGLNSMVSSLEVFQDSLIAGGGFAYAGGVRIYGLARWDGTNWNALGTTPIGDVSAIVPYKGKLIVGGNMPSDYIARRDESSWGSLGSGLNDIASALVVYKDALFVGGFFSTAGGKASPCIARWDDTITPVEVQDFQAIARDDAVYLTWTLARDAVLHILGLRVERAETHFGPYREISVLAPEMSMSFTDPDLERGHGYWYRLVLHTDEGKDEVVGPVAVTTDVLTWKTWLYPPVAASVQGPIEIRYSIGSAQTPVRLALYDAHGRLVRSFEQSFRDPGEYRQVWNRRDDEGTAAVRGVYFVRLIAGQTQAAQKFVLLDR